jgi:PAS domain S-box-containing protein
MQKPKQNKISFIMASNILNSAPGNVYIKDVNGRYLGCNKEALSILNISDENEIIGKTDYDILPKEIADGLRKIDQDIINNGATYVTEEVGQDANFKKAIFLTKKTPLYDEEGNVIGLIGISFDITDKKRAEQEKIEKYQENEITLENIIASMPGNVYWVSKNGV